MIITRLSGGLGNQMFQYAVGKTLADKLGQPMKVDISGYDTRVQGDTPRSYRLQFFEINTEIASPEEIRSYKYPHGIISKGWRYLKKKIFRKFYMDWHPEIVKNTPKYLDGFFQSEKYFLSNRAGLLKDFTIKPQYISDEALDFKKNIESVQDSVSLHVRRGDYFANTTTTKIHGVNLSAYYQKAIALITQKVANPHFFVFSDDIDWVKENIKISDGAENVTYVSKSPSEKEQLQDYEELVLMSKCNHHIIANSSFSWWGAWLNPSHTKIVVAPKQWTVKNTDHPNIIPDNWIKI